LSGVVYGSVALRRVASRLVVILFKAFGPGS
jgi:hypothetical protein